MDYWVVLPERFPEIVLSTENFFFWRSVQTSPSTVKRKLLLRTANGDLCRCCSDFGTRHGREIYYDGFGEEFQAAILMPSSSQTSFFRTNKFHTVRRIPHRFFVELQIDSPKHKDLRRKIFGSATPIIPTRPVQDIDEDQYVYFIMEYEGVRVPATIQSVSVGGINRSNAIILQLAEDRTYSVEVEHNDRSCCLLKKAIYGSVRRSVPFVEGEGEILMPLMQIPSSSSIAVAIKMISIEMLKIPKNKLKDDPTQEMAALRHLSKCDCVVPVEKLCSDGVLFHYIIMPMYSGGELLDCVDPERGFCPDGDERRLQRLFGQIARGVRAMHNLRVVHGDLSLENVVIHRAGTAEEKCAVMDLGRCLRIPTPLDFELGCGSGERSERKSHRRNEIGGGGGEQVASCEMRSGGVEEGAPAEIAIEVHKNTSQKSRVLIKSHMLAYKAYYRSPEIFSSAHVNPFDQDIWALGIILYVMIAGTFPFDIDSNESMKAWYAAIQKGDLVNVRTMRWDPRTSTRTFPFLKDIVSGDALHLLKRLLCCDPDMRCSCEEVLLHPWLNEA